MHLALVTEPSSLPLSPTEARQRQGLPARVSDDLIGTFIKVETQKLDGPTGMLGRALVTQTWDLTLDAFPGVHRHRFLPVGYVPRWNSGPIRWHQEEIEIPLPPLQQIISISYLDTEGETQTVDPATYRVIKGEPAYVIPTGSNSWPGDAGLGGAVTIRFRAGYGDNEASVPEPIRQAIAAGVQVQVSSASADPLIRSETVDGVGSWTYNTGATMAGGAAPYMDAALQQFRVSGGIS